MTRGSCPVCGGVNSSNCWKCRGGLTSQTRRRSTVGLAALTVGALSLGLLVSACSALGDRTAAGAGTQPDLLSDAAYVAIYRNIDNYPNIAKICADGLGFATTSTGRGESAGATPLIRVPEWDGFCTGKVATP